MVLWHRKIILMHESLLICLALIFSAFILVLIARRLSVPYPIFLVMAGLFISFVPSVPKIQIDPYIVFLIILPPVLFDTFPGRLTIALCYRRNSKYHLGDSDRPVDHYYCYCDQIGGGLHFLPLQGIYQSITTGTYNLKISLAWINIQPLNLQQPVFQMQATGISI